MTTISEENRKYLREAMRVDCGFRETVDEPTSITPIGNDAEFVGLENFGHEHFTTALMDLGGDGFQNDGNAVPMQTDTDSYRYGIISEGATKDDGTFENPFGVTIGADVNWETVTVELMSQSGQIQVVRYNPVWISGEATIYIDTFFPNERAYIVSVFLGKAWIWNNENLLSASLDLRGVNTEIGGELEVSSINIEAYELNDPTDYIGNIPLGAPIWYVAGYEGDASAIRNFYLSEIATWEDNVLNVQGQDATSLIDDKEKKWAWYQVPTGYAIPWFIDKNLKYVLEDINIETVGTYPNLTNTADIDIYYEGGSPRSAVSLYTGIFRDSDYSRVTYVDAGRPCLTWGDTARTFTIYADEISDLKASAAQNINDVSANLATYEAGDWETIEEFGAVAGRTYYFTIDAPVYDVYVWPWGAETTWLNSKVLKVVIFQTDPAYELRIRRITPVIANGDNPYHEIDLTVGTSYAFDDTIPSLPTSSGSLTKLCLPKLLERSNQTYEFTYRGNPHIQPRDMLNVEIATWEDVFEIVDGLLPQTDLYPSASLYPYAVYKKVRKMVKRWETMTVDSLTLEHKEGGLTSTIKARKGVV